MMKYIFIFLLSVHGFIHLMGFVKAFGLSDVKQLSQHISKPAGILWMCAFILFLLCALLFSFKYNYWWAFALVGALLSQVLVIYFWKDAKFGTVANVIILVAAVVGFATWNFYKHYKDDVNNNFGLNNFSADTILTEADIEDLPLPVKRYIRYTGCIGKPKVHNFKIDFKGAIRKNEEAAWMPFSSEQYNFMNNATRLFFMKADMMHLPVAGYHRYENGKAMMDIRLLSLVRVQYADGADMDEAETVTFFNDMCCMAPATLTDKRIKWLSTDSNTVKASFTNNNISITAWLYFNDRGELVNFVSNDRLSADAGRKIPWATPLKDYKDINGYRLAGTAETIYRYPDRDLCYGKFELSDIKYNCKK